MNKTSISLAVAATLILSSSLVAQTAPSEPVAKPSPYEGVSAPPANDAITTTEQAPLVAPAVAPPMVVAPRVAPAVVPHAPVPGFADSNNPDAGIIETPLPPDTPEFTPHPNALHARSLDADSNLDEGIVTYVPGPANALPEGTVFRVRMLQEIDAASTAAGTPFRAALAQDILRNGKVVVPVGSELRGRVMSATAGKHITGGSVLHLRPDEFVLPDGTRYRLHAQVIDTAGSDTKARGEGDIAANEHGKRSIAELGMGAGSGAIVGAAVGGGVGAVVGTAVGAGVVTAHWLLTNWSADLPESSVVVFSLTDPMFLTQAQVQDPKSQSRTQSN